MNREYVLGIAAVVVAVAALATLALSGAIAAPETETGAAVDRGGHASLQEVTIAAGEVSGETVSLEVDAFLEHRGDPVENVTVVHRVTDTDTGLVTATTEQPVGRLAGTNETAVPATVDVPRAGQHRIETFVIVDGTRRESTTHRVSGLESLTPAYADTGLEFHRFGDDALAGVPAIEYSIESTTDETATLEVTSYLTNAGDEATDSLEVELKARQAGSNIVADAETVPVSNVDPGETARPTAELEVPDEYRYHLDAILWLDGTIVATDRAGADLRPNSTAGDSPDAELETGDFDDEPTIEQAGDSSSDGTAGDDGTDDADGAEDSVDGTPGFGPVAAAIALGGTIALVFARERDRNENR